MNGYGSHRRLTATAFSVIQNHDDDRLSEDVLRRSEKARGLLCDVPELVVAERT
jgi:hypothetical protein